MKVRLKTGWSKAYPEFTAGNVYRVLGIENDWLRVISDDGEPTLFNPKAFEFVDAAQPPDWISERGDEGELYAYPPELRDPRYFFEKFFDYDMLVRSKFHGYVHQLCHAERALAANPPNTFIRVKWKHSSLVLEDPITFYSEFDGERWEVRKVEVFADGRLGYANARGTFGFTRLGEHPVPALAEMGRNPEFDPAEIAAAEFEAIWDKALSAEEAFDRENRER